MRLPDGKQAERHPLSWGDQQPFGTRLPAPHKLVDGFSKEHGCTLLVWFEQHDDLQQARARELQMKKWKRAWKLDMIEQGNPQWKDLYETLF